MRLPPPAAAARRAAETLVERLDLSPPVDIEALLSDRAVVQRVSWPFGDVDAVVHGLGGSFKPSVFYRATDNPLRERFTLAHELGHVLLPWHLPSANCVSGTGSMEDVELFGQEQEADIFASCILLPDRWLLSLVRESRDDGTSLLRAVESAQVTTVAALIALRRVLLAGWAFSAYGGNQVVASMGTVLPDSALDGPDLNGLKKESKAWGTAILNGHSLAWFRMMANDDMPDPAVDSRSDRELLTEAIALREPDQEERERLEQVCNGIVGGSLRVAARRPAEETFNVLRYKFEQSPNRNLLDEPEFTTWLARKATAIQNGTTKRARYPT